MPRPVISKRALKQLGKTADTIAAGKADERTIQGQKALMARIQELEAKVAKRIMRKGAAKAVQVIAKQMRQMIPTRFKDARKAIGSKAKQGKRHEPVVARAGVGVAKKKRKLRAMQSSITRGKGRGVGIGPANFHWLVLGTKERFTKTGRPRGRMKATFPGFAKKAAQIKGTAAHAEMLRVMRKELWKEVARLRSQVRG